MRTGFFAIVLYLGSVASGCVRPAPDLHALYANAARETDRTPVVVVHGILGARLRDRAGGRELWPGGFWRLLFDDYSDLRLPIDPATLEVLDDGLEPYDFFDGAVGEDFYGRLMATLTGPGGYHLRRIDDRPPNIYRFVYDWRRDNVENASGLDDLIEEIRRQYRDPGLRVDIVAHSMGGILVRYFERYGREDVLEQDAVGVTGAGAGKLRKVVLIGTPNFGSISGLQTALMGASIGFGTIRPEIGATWPSVYQILPNPAWDWMVDIRGRRVERDLFDVETWRYYGWSIFDSRARARIRASFDDPAEANRYLETLERFMAKQLRRARRFHRALSESQPTCPVRYIVFGGDCILTPARCLVEEIEGRTVVRLSPGQIRRPLPGVDYDALMLEPGDGRVTKPSALGRKSLDPSARVADAAFPLAYAVFLCEEHGALPGDVTFRDNLLNILLSP